MSRLAKWLWLLALVLACCPGLLAQGGGYTQVTATVKDPNGQLYVNAPYSVTFFDPGTSGKLPLLNGSTFQTSFTGINTDSFGNLVVILPDNGIIASSSGATNTQWTFSICSQSIQGHQYCFQYRTTIDCLDNIPSACTNNSMDISTQLQAAAAILPIPGSITIQVQGVSVINPNFANSPTVTWTVVGSNIQATAIGGGGGGGGSTVSINGVGTTTPNFLNTSTFQFTLVGNTVTGIPVAQGNEGELQLNHAGLPAAVTGLGVDSALSPTTFINPLDLELKGPNYAADMRSYGARATGPINTTGTGSGSSLTVGVSTFKNGDGITVAGVGNVPVIAIPTGLSVSSGWAAGLTVPDAPMVNASIGSSTDTYAIFACTIADGCTRPTATVMTTTAAASLGTNAVAISTWSLTGNTLTIVTSVPNGFAAGTYTHNTGTSNNALGGGWYPISSITNPTTYVINNVPQYAATVTSGTGGLATAMAGNTLSWTASTGGTPGTGNMPWEYFVCAQRPGDGAMHIIGRSFPSTFYAESNGGNFSTTFVDFGPTITANPQVPWDISDANCTAVSAQREMFTTTVSAGGGSTGLTLASPMLNAASGALVRKDDAVSFLAAANAAHASGGSFYIPIVSGGFILNSSVNMPFSTSIWQAGGLTVNSPIIVKGSVNWFGITGIQPTPAFGFNGAPVITCNAWPCIYVGDIANQANGGTTFDTLTFSSPQNGLEMLVDADWGMIWNKVNFQSGAGNLDNAGMGLVIRPGAANYTITNSNFVGGPNQVIDQTWTPLFYADKGHSGCCSGAGNTGNITMVNTQWNRRGFYYLANGGDGVHFTSTVRTYRQGGITPMFVAQNINGNVGGAVEIDNMFHDTESQATYAWICNLNCSGGFGVPTHLGFVNQVSQDAGTIPGQITGGGNQGIMNVVAAYSPWGTTINGAFGTVPTGLGWTITLGKLVPSVSLSLGNYFGTFVDISPSVPTPQLSLESGAFFGNAVAGPLTASRTYTFPDTSGIVCLTSTCGGQFYQTIQVSTIAQTQRPILNLIPGTNITINCVDNIPATRSDCTFIASSTAATAWASVTAGNNANPGTFAHTGNSWDYSAASSFKAPTVGISFPGSASGSVSLLAQAAAGTPTVTFGTSSGTPAVTASSPLAITAATGNITCATCVTTSGGGALSATAPITVSAGGLIAINTASTGGLGAIQLAGDLAGTGTVPIVVSTHITGASTNALAKFNAGGNTVNSVAIDTGSLFTIPETLDLISNAQVSEVANEGVTGTTLHKLASLTGAPSTAKITTAGATSGAIGIVVGGAGITSNALVAVDGQTTCVFDGSTTAGDYVQISASVNGDCTDAGASPPATGEIIGQVLSTNAGTGTYNVYLFSPGTSAGGGGGGSGTINACASFATSPITFYSASTAVSCDSNITISTSTLNLGIAGTSSGTLAISGSVSGTVSIKTQNTAGTYNYNLPTTAGASTFLLTSAGGAGAPMTWTSPIITIDGISCSVGSSCTTLSLSTNSIANTSQTALNFVTSVGNVIGLTLTPANVSSSQEIFEITGITTPAGGGTGIQTPTAHSLLVSEGAAVFNLITSPSVNGYYLCGFNVIASAPVDPTCNPIGIPVNAQTGTTYTIGAAQPDRSTLITASNSGAQTYTAVNPTTTGFGSNFPYVIKNIGTGAVTEVSSGFNVGGGTSLLIPPNWTVFHWSDNVNYIVSRFPDFPAFPNCVDTGGNHLNFTTSTGAFSCGTSGGGGGGGTVTQVNTSSPLTGGGFTTTGTIACATCVTSAAALTSTAIVLGGGLQATSTDASATLIGGALNLANGGSVTLGGSISGTFAISVDSAAATLSLGANATLTSAGALTVVSCSGCSVGTTALSSITAATSSNTIANGNRPQVWNWAQTTGSQTAFTFGETTAASGTGDIELAVTTLAGSTAIPFVVTDSLTGSQVLPALKITPTWNTSGVVDAAILLNVTNTASGANSLLMDLQVGGTTQFKVDKAGNITSTGLQQYSGSGAIALPGTAHFVAVAEGATTQANYITPTANVGWCFLSNGLGSDPTFQACPSASTAFSALAAATAANTIASGNNGAQVWGWKQTTASQTALTINDTTAATGAGDILMAITTVASSTEIPLVITNSLGAGQNLPSLKILSTWNTALTVDAAFLMNVTNTASGAGSLLMDLQVGGTSEFTVDKAGNGTFTGTMTSNGASLGAATATSLLASGNVDGTVPVTITTGTTATLGGTFNSGYTYNQNGTAATAVTYTLPTAAIGKQYCIGNGHGSVVNTGSLTLQTSAAGQLIIFTDGTLSASGGFVSSAGAARDSACVVGTSSTTWMLYVQSGTWTKH